jgi:hypothetical protein
MSCIRQWTGAEFLKAETYGPSYKLGAAETDGKVQLSVVFVSYDRESRSLAEALAEDIRALGHTAWFDEELAGGQLWWDKILETVRACDVFLPVLTPRSLSSTACEREHGYAAALGKPILPVLASDGVSTNLLPPSLALLQFVDYRSRDRNAPLRLARAPVALPQPRPLPNPLPPAPDVPSSYLGGVAQRLTASVVLSYEEQSALVFDLKGSLRDSETAEDARSLLKQMRKRRDLFASMAQEIDEMLGQPAPVLDQLGSREVRSASSLAATVADATVVSPRPTVDAPTRRHRLYVALAGAIIGMVWGTVVTVVWGKPAGWFIGAALGGLGGAGAGALAAKRWTVLLAGLLGAVAVFLFWLYADRRDPDALLLAGVFGAPSGVLVGALLGVLFLKLGRNTNHEPRGRRYY